MSRSIQNLNIGLKYFFANTPKGRKIEDLYYKFYSYVADNPFNQFSIEVLLESESHFELLKKEFLLLQAGKPGNKCLNNVFEPYIPDFTQSNKKKAWLNRGSYLNFMEWKKKYETNQNMPV